MTLGEKLKKLRTIKGMSQPEFAQLAGIEQSYLSKLENDKSLPSNDIFRQLLSAFSMSISEFLKDFDQAYLHQQLGQIPDIDHWLIKQNQQKFTSQRQYLYTCSALIVLAITLFYTGYSKLLFNEVHFQYRSPGVVLPGEPGNIFYNWKDLILNDGSKAMRDLYNKKRVEIAQRKEYKHHSSIQFLGENYQETTENGRRIYELIETKKIANPLNAWLQIIAVLLLSCGLMGLVIERRIYKTR